MPKTGLGEFVNAATLARLSRLPFLARLPMMGSVSGLHRSATRGSSIEFAEYRKYAQGDDLRHLDWRVFARTDRFYMKEFEADTNLRCCFVLDASGSMGFAGTHGSRFDYARRIVATLAHLLALQGDAVGMVVFAGGIRREAPPRDTPGHLKAICEILSSVSPAGETAIVETLHAVAEKMRQRALVVIVSDFLADAGQVLDCFHHMRFRRHDVAVFHLLDRDEMSLNFDRPIRFEDMEGGADIVADPSIIREAYEEQVRHHLGRMRDGSREFGVDYRLVTTDMDCEKVLGEFLLQRSRRGGGARPQ